MTTKTLNPSGKNDIVLASRTGIAYALVALLILASCSQNGPMDDSYIDRYEASVHAMTSALASDNLSAAQKAMADFIPIANDLAKAMISVSPQQQERINEISNAGTQAANQVQARALLVQFEKAVGDLERYASTGDDAAMTQYGPATGELADTLSLLETSMDAGQGERYTALTTRFAALASVIAGDARLAELASALDDYRQAVRDQKPDFAQEHANNVKVVAEELRLTEGLSSKQVSRLAELLSGPEAQKILGE